MELQWQSKRQLINKFWEKIMLGVEFLDGQGLGNQMFCLASVKSLALDNVYVFDMK